MVEETVWIEKKYVRPRLNSDELWLIYRLIDNQYWLLSKGALVGPARFKFTFKFHNWLRERNTHASSETAVLMGFRCKAGNRF